LLILQNKECISSHLSFIHQEIGKPPNFTQKVTKPPRLDQQSLFGCLVFGQNDGRIQIWRVGFLPTKSDSLLSIRLKERTLLPGYVQLLVLKISFHESHNKLLTFSQFNHQPLPLFHFSECVV
jgi:hypothetical protein